MPLLPRFYQKQIQAQDAAHLAEILVDSGGEAPPDKIKQPHTKPGDTRRLRGIPVIGAVSGTQPGTDPFKAAVRRGL